MKRSQGWILVGGFCVCLALGLARSGKEPASPRPQAVPPLAEAKGADAARIVADSDSLPPLSAATIAEIEARFARPYAAQEPEPGVATREAIARLLLLKALGKNEEPSLVPALLRLYRRVLEQPGENWAIRREALRNALALSPYLEESERDLMIARAPKNLLAAAALTDRELTEEALAHGH